MSVSVGWDKASGWATSCIAACTVKDLRASKRSGWRGASVALLYCEGASLRVEELVTLEGCTYIEPQELQYTRHM